MKDIIDLRPSVDSFDDLGGAEGRPILDAPIFQELPAPDEEVSILEVQTDPRQVLIDNIRRMSQEKAERPDYQNVTTEANVRPVSW